MVSKLQAEGLSFAPGLVRKKIMFVYISAKVFIILLIIIVI